MISQFPHEAGPPGQEALFLALGAHVPIWQAMVDRLESASGTPGTWKSYGPKYGWRKDFRKGSSPLAGLYPGHGTILLGINLLQKEWDRAFELPLSFSSRQVLEHSEPLRDGRFLLLPIVDAETLGDAETLIQLKTRKTRRP